MTMMSATETTPVLIVPKPRQNIAFACGVSGLILFLVLLAIADLLIAVNWGDTIPSVLWFGILFLLIWPSFLVRGLRGAVLEFLSEFSASHFADVTTEGDGEKSVRFGFTMLGHRFYCQKIAIRRIETVEWKPGRATDMAGQDMNDWHVSLWFDHDDRDRSERWKHARKPDQDIYIVGPSRRKELTAAFGRELLSFLKHAGAVLEQGDNDHTFVRKSIDSTQ
jgi:hypothetical protein